MELTTTGPVASRGLACVRSVEERQPDGGGGTVGSVLANYNTQQAVSWTLKMIGAGGRASRILM